MAGLRTVDKKIDETNVAPQTQVVVTSEQPQTSPATVVTEEEVASDAEASLFRPVVYKARSGNNNYRGRYQ